MIGWLSPLLCYLSGHATVSEFSVHYLSTFSHKISYTSMYLHNLSCLAPFNELLR